LQVSNDGREEIKPFTECTKIDQLGDNTTEIKNRISQKIRDINSLNSIRWHKILQKIENYIFIKL
jgi:hypothetical protein